MIYQRFTLPSTIDRLRQEPLGEHMDAYACFVAEQGYAPSSIRSQIVVIEDFGRWLRQKHIDVSSLDRGITDRFLRTCRRPVAAARRGEARTLDRLLLLLRQRGVVQLRPDQPIETARQRVVEEFRRYLLQERRLSPATPHNYVPVVISSYPSVLLARHSKCRRFVRLMSPGSFAITLISSALGGRR